MHYVYPDLTLRLLLHDCESLTKSRNNLTKQFSTTKSLRHDKQFWQNNVDNDCKTEKYIVLALENAKTVISFMLVQVHEKTSLREFYVWLVSVLGRGLGEPLWRIGLASRLVKLDNVLIPDWEAMTKGSDAPVASADSSLNTGLLICKKSKSSSQSN